MYIDIDFITQNWVILSTLKMDLAFDAGCNHLAGTGCFGFFQTFNLNSLADLTTGSPAACTTA